MKGLEKQYYEYLKDLGYSDRTPDRQKSTTYDYCKRINKVCETEGLTWESLAARIDGVIIEYDKGGAKETQGSQSNNAVINAIKRYKDFLVFSTQEREQEQVRTAQKTIDRNKVVFINLTEMLKYDGQDSERAVKGGGQFVDIHGYGHELFNFRPDGGKYYGFAPRNSHTNINRIAKNEIREDEQGRKYIDNVLVIFTATRGGRIIVGYYKHARVYENAIESNSLSRFIKGNEYAGYNMICDVEDGKLLDYDEREVYIPHSLKEDGGFGHSSLWYADAPEVRETREKLIDYVEDIINEVKAFDDTDDERKYGSFDESGRSRMTIEVIKRSRAARQACLDLKGYTCVVCGFNFETAYGTAGKDYIEVHHATESATTISQRQGYAGTDPEKDLEPVCSNCHSMLHRKRPAYTIAEVKAMFKN